MIFELLFRLHDLPGLGWLNVLRYTSFRAIMSALTAMVVSFLVAPWFISKLRGKQISQIIREEGPETHLAKRGTPTTSTCPTFSLPSCRTACACISFQQKK